MRERPEEKNVSNKKGFTLVEILVTVVILAALAAIVIPGFSKSITKAEVNQAVAYLRTIRTAEKMYYAKWGEYACAGATDCDTTTKIKTILGAETAAKHYAFSVTATPTTYTATAAGTSTITLDDAGDFKKDDASFSPN